MSINICKKIRNKRTKVASVKIHLKYFFPLMLLFFTNFAEAEAQGTYVVPGLGTQSNQFNHKGPYPHSIGNISREVYRRNAQALHLYDDLPQAASKNWSEPVLLFQAGSTKEIHSPFVIADSYGNVHVFWTLTSGSQDELDAIYYMRLDSEGWTTPVDVVAAAPARAARAAISQDDFIHLIWNGLGGISYSRAPIHGAEIVHNWSEPVVITDANIHASIVNSPSEIIYLAYPGVGQSGIFEQVLEPNLSWSSAITISENFFTNTASDYVQMGVSSNGVMHVAWTEFYYPESWPPRGVFYSNSTDGGNSWSAPVLLAGDGFDQINVSVVDDSIIHVAWNGMAGVGGRYHRWSSDGGQTWSQTIEVVPPGVGGTEGFPQLVGDNAGTLHLLTTYEGCAWYTYFENYRWAAPVCISGNEARASDYIEESSMGVSEGDRLHAVFWDARKRLWYTTKITDASWIPPKTIDNGLIQPAQSPIPTVFPVITPTAHSTSLPADWQIAAESRFNYSPGQILILSLSPVLLLIVVIAVFRFYKGVR